MGTISDGEKIWRRAGHISFEHNGDLYIWGGFTEHLPAEPQLPNTVPKNGNNLHESHQILSYDSIYKSWRIWNTTGAVPPRGLGTSGAYHDNNFYIFGGQHGYPDDDIGFVEGNNNNIYQLNLISLTWKILYAENQGIKSSILPSEKSLMTYHANGLYVFGGYSEAPDPYKSYQITPKFSADPTSHFQWQRGWNGSLNMFDLTTKSWLAMKNCPGHPRAGHAGVILENHWIIFGGRGLKGRFNDVLSFNFVTMNWSILHPGHHPDVLYYLNRDPVDCGIVINERNEVLPEPRSGHTLTRIGNSNKLFLYGGIGMLNTPLNDAWILTISENQEVNWSLYELPYDHGAVRCLHTSTFLTSSNQLIIHSGCTQEYYSNHLDLNDHTPTILTFQFGIQSLLQITLNFIENRPEEFNTEILPHNLKTILKTRSKSDDKYSIRRPRKDMEPVFSRSLLHAGL